MSENSQIIHWIMIGIQQELNDQSELFYFDKKEKQFFSILHIDYLLFDQNLNIIEDISLYYTKEELNLLRKRIKKIALRRFFTKILIDILCPNPCQNLC